MSNLVIVQLQDETLNSVVGGFSWNFGSGMTVLKNSSLQQNVSTVTLANVNMGVKNRQGYVGNSSNLTINVAQAINSNNFATS